MGTVWRGYVTVNGQTTLQLEVSRNIRSMPGRQWALYRLPSWSRENFRTATEARAWGSRINPKVEWKQEGNQS